MIMFSYENYIALTLIWNRKKEYFQAYVVVSTEKWIYI